MKLLSRLFYFFYRIFNSLRFLGGLNTFKIFIISNLSKKKNLHITLFNKKFYFRPIIDTGSYRRFTFSQYIIKDTQVQPLEYFIDAGANIGSQTIRIVNLNKNIKKIACIEPDIESAKICKKNLINYSAEVYNNALSSDDGKELMFQNSFNSEMSEIIEEKKLIKSNSVYPIKTISINQIVKELNFPRIDFIKFDINGYEKDVFSKNTEWINITNAIAFNNADINELTHDIIKKIQQVYGDVKIYNIDQMIIVMRKNLNWVTNRGFLHYKKVGEFESDERK